MPAILHLTYDSIIKPLGFWLSQMSSLIPRDLRYVAPRRDSCEALEFIMRSGSTTCTTITRLVLLARVPLTNPNHCDSPLPYFLILLSYCSTAIKGRYSRDHFNVENPNSAKHFNALSHAPQQITRQHLYMSPFECNLIKAPESENIISRSAQGTSLTQLL